MDTSGCVTKASYLVNIFILFCIFQLTYLNCFRKELDKIGSRSVRCWGLRTQNFRKSKINSKKRYQSVGGLFSFLRKLPLFKFPNYPDLACVSQKTRKRNEPEKPFVKLRPAYSVKLFFSYVVKGIKLKITAEFRDTAHIRFEDTKGIISPEKFRDPEQTTPDLCSFLLTCSDSAELDKCALDVLTRWRDKEDSDASMASLEKALTEIGRENILEDFKRLAYRSYAKDPAVVVVQTRPVNSALEEVPVDDSDPGHRRISEFLDTAGEMDDMFRAEDDSSSPRTPRFSGRDEVFTDENGAEPITEESVIVVEKHRLVDEEGNLIGETHKIMQDGNEVAEEDREKLLQDFFSNDKGVLDFLASENAAKVVENGKGTEETEI